MKPGPVSELVPTTAKFHIQISVQFSPIGMFILNNI
jgi:hypothetical protein